MKNREEFVQAVRKYIAHKKKLSETSSYYKNVERLKSIAALYNLFVACKKKDAATNYRTICKMVVMNSKHLNNVLPCIKNPSFEKSIITFHEIMNHAREVVNSKPKQQQLNF